MPNDLQSPLDRHIVTFMDRLTAENYKPQTIKAYRGLLKRLISLIEAAGISPQDLTAERAAELVRNDVLPKADRKSTRLNSSHSCASRMPSSACKKKKTT